MKTPGSFPGARIPAALLAAVTLSVAFAPPAIAAGPGNPPASGGALQTIKGWFGAKPTDLLDPTKRGNVTSQAQVAVSSGFQSAVAIAQKGGPLMQAAGVDAGSIAAKTPPPASMVNKLWKHMKSQTTVDAKGMVRRVYPNASRDGARALINKAKDNARRFQKIGNTITGGALAVEMGYRASQGDYSGAVVHGVNNYVKIKIGAAVAAKVGGKLSLVASPWVGVPVGIVAGVIAGWIYDGAQKHTVGTPDDIATKISLAMVPDPKSRRPTAQPVPAPTPQTGPTPPPTPPPPPPTPTPPPVATPATTASTPPADGRPPGYPPTLPWPPKPAEEKKDPPPGGGTPTVVGKDPPTTGGGGTPPTTDPGKDPATPGGTPPTVAGGDPPATGPGTDPKQPGGKEPQPGDPNFVGPVQPPGTGSEGKTPTTTGPKTTDDPKTASTPSSGTKSAKPTAPTTGSDPDPSGAARTAARQTAKTQAREAGKSAARTAAKPPHRPPTPVRPPKPIRPPKPTRR